MPATPDMLQEAKLALLRAEALALDLRRRLTMAEVDVKIAAERVRIIEQEVDVKIAAERVRIIEQEVRLNVRDEPRPL